MEEHVEILFGEIKIKTLKNFETGKWELLVHLSDPNDVDAYYFVKELKIGNIKFVPFRAGEDCI